MFKGQPVLDAFGIVGQVTQVDNTPPSIILISDAEHAMPVQVNRNGIRSIAVGTGDVDKLSLPFLTVESDVKPGDLLVSSGLDGIFPAGYPVARIVARSSAIRPRRSRSSKRSRWRNSIAIAKCCCCGPTSADIARQRSSPPHRRAPKP